MNMLSQAQQHIVDSTNDEIAVSIEEVNRLEELEIEKMIEAFEAEEMNKDW